MKRFWEEVTLREFGTVNEETLELSRPIAQEELEKMRMSDELMVEIQELEKAGWKLCVGCVHYFYDSECCSACPIETRKHYGLSP